MTPFTIDNLPYGVISTVQNPRRRCAIAFEDSAIDIDVLYRDGFFSSISALRENIFAGASWNAFAILPSDVRTAFRDRLKAGILDNTINHALLSLSTVQNHLPMVTHNFSDFYCSLEHASNCSKVFNLTLQPNWFAIPSVYNGRTSSLAVSGTPVTRPYGMQRDLHDVTSVSFRPERQMDYELEMGFWLSKPFPRGQRLKIADAKDHIFGVTLLNDWSARQIQGFEMPPLGPFHSKGSATSISPWIVPIESLEAIKCERKTKQEPSPPPHLIQLDETASTFDIDLSVKILRDDKLYTLCESNLNELHWTPFQQLTHLASAGEGLTTGDVFGTGTISSTRTNLNGEKIGLGCLFERKLPEAKLESVPSDLFDTFLKDGDEVILEAWCKDKTTGKVILGFGECRAKLLPAVDE
ncbi:Fumarylacetoacetase [Cladobotryum mycophilum]|uniref:Fumarylacetoacetase n=1 Tax=Cladobotryum mycophilum TaxID=491253 RepID=A0ABR0SVV0_9HYPO